MDAGHRSTRVYPSYSTQELELWIAEGRVTGEKADAVKREIEARKSGASKHFSVPQIEGGTPYTMN